MGIDDQERAVHRAGEDRGIRHGGERRAVENDHVSGVLQSFDDAAHALRPQQLGGVRWDRTGGHHAEPGLLGLACDGAHRQCFIPQQGREPLVVCQLEVVVELGDAKVGVDQDRRTPGLAEGDREVRADRRLSLALARARHEDRLDGSVDVCEVEVRSQGPEGLGAA